MSPIIVIFACFLFAAVGYVIGLNSKVEPVLSDRQLIAKLVARIAAKRMLQLTSAEVSRRIDTLAESLVYEARPPEAVHDCRRKFEDDYVHPIT